MKTSDVAKLGSSCLPMLGKRLTVSPNSWRLDMPRTKRVCFCDVFRRVRPPIDSRKAQEHITAYRICCLNQGNCVFRDQTGESSILDQQI